MRNVAARPRLSPMVIGFLFFLGALFLAYIMGHWVLEERTFGLAERVGMLFGLGGLLIVLGRWRFGVLVFLVWLTLEDLVRKYAGNNMTIYFVKDALLLVIYAAFCFALMKRRERLFRPRFWVPLLAFEALALVQIFNPRSSSIFYGLLGMQMYLFYMPLLFIGYALLSNLVDLEQFLDINLKIAVVVAGVGIVQASGHRTFLNPAVLAPMLRNLGHLVRYAPGMTHILQAPPSVFVSQGRYANYLEMMFTLALGTLAFKMFRHRSCRWTYLSLAVLGVAIFLSGSKGALIYTLITIFAVGVILLWGVRGQPWVTARLGKMMRRGVIALAGGFCLFIVLFPRLTSSWGDYYYDLLWPDSANSELGFRVGNYPLSQFEAVLHYPDWITGYGTGTASLGTQYLTGRFNVPPPAVPPVENGYGTILIEMGILGPILWVLMGGAIVLSGWRLTRKLASTSVYPVTVCIVWFAFWVFFPFTWGSMTIYQNFVVNAYLWLLLGILFRVPTYVGGARLWQPEASAVARPAEPVHAGQAP